MARIFLGYPPEHIKNWIINHSKPAVNPKTKITFVDGEVVEYDWSGEINQQTMVDAGLYDNRYANWIKEPQTVEIGTNVMSIGYGAFYRCSGLTSVMIPSSVMNIGNQVFSQCSGLTSVTIPSSVTSIMKSAFVYCTSLTSVTIPNSVESIGGSVFSNCTSLTSVTIGNSVTSIGEGAFYGCSGLTSVTFSGKNKATVKDIEYYPWNLNSGCVIHCMDGDITL